MLPVERGCSPHGPLRPNNGGVFAARYSDFIPHRQQGQRLIHNAEFGEESLSLSCEAAGGGREMDGSDQARPIEGRVSERGGVLRGGASEDRAAVLLERRVAHVRQADFDGSPVFKKTVFKDAVLKKTVRRAAGLVVLEIEA